MTYKQLAQEIDEIVVEFFPEGLPPSRTDAAIKRRQCKVINPLDEDNVPEIESPQQAHLLLA